MVKAVPSQNQLEEAVACARRDTKTLDLFAPRPPKPDSEEGLRPTALWQPPTFQVLDASAIEVRPYFQVAFDAWEGGGNVGLVADTSTGKTYLAYALADAVLARGERILFCAPTTALCEQHAALARVLFRLPHDGIRFVSGQWTPKRRTNVWAGGQILIATPQTTANDIVRGMPILDGIGLVVVDEAHHASRTYASIAIANAAHERGIRILALTASPGGTMERIERIRANLHLNRWVRIPEECTQAFRPPVREEREEVAIADAVRPLVAELESLVERLTQRLVDAKFLERATRTPSPVELKRAFDRIDAAGKRAGSFLPYVAAAQQIATVVTLVVADDYGVALESLRRALEKRANHGGFTQTARRLRTTPEVQRAVELLDQLRGSQALHPKQEVAIRTVRRALAEANRPVRVLVFDRYAEGAMRLVALLRGALGVQVEVALGRARMRSDRLIQTLLAFGRGEFPILVGTDVIREGIHIPAIDHLIAYSPPRNERELIQLYGRVGRTHSGRITTILADHEYDRRYAFSAAASARRMREVIATASAAVPIRGTNGATHESFFTRHRRKTPEGFVDALRDTFVFERFAVVEARVEASRNGLQRPYVRLLVGDRTRTVPLLHWCPRGRLQAERIVRDFPTGAVVIVSGTYEHGGSPRIIVNPGERQGITRCPETDYDPADYDRTPPF